MAGTYPTSATSCSPRSPRAALPAPAACDATRALGWQRRLRRSLRVALGNGATPGQEATLDDAMGLFDELLDLGDARGSTSASPMTCWRWGGSWQLTAPTQRNIGWTSTGCSGYT
ncbi:hypothetical protein G7085_10935 [Tessaracoccus sp. HDW20]|uniref:hypothetical protein n=1 Tax=Tessaracoccus coleopterorum TaxID=2714950 RepID=UPI0018D4A2E9|nr:hypothetical protein [Tessaracoccus coleopterorum]NHB84950.1 hypothetical protein [Tessaracoccus coleopterorum]